MKNPLLWLLLSLFCLESCHFNYWKLRQSSRVIRRDMAESRPLFRFEINYFETPTGQKMRFMSGGNPAADRLVFFLHGSPSSISKWAAFFKDTGFQKQARLVAIDRPGYGKSDLGHSITDLEVQNALIAPLVERFLAEKAGRKVIFVGSSYGATLAVRMATGFADRLGGLLLSGASLAKGAERIPKIARAVHAVPFIFPRVARAATREKFAHQKTLAQLEKADWAGIRCRVKMVHGIFDDLIFFPQNPDFGCKQLENALEIEYICVPTKHFLMWTHPEAVIDGLRDLLRPSYVQKP